MNPLLEQFRLCPAPTESNSPSTKISRCHTEKSWKIFLIFFFLFLITPPTRPLFNCITKKKKNTLRNNKRGKNKRASGSEISIFQNYSCDLHRRMDQQEMIDAEGWTEERHAAFLNWMEESFVLRMFSPNSKKATGFWSSQQCSPATCRDLPLNRLIPDSATESTGDSRPRRSRLLVESGNRDLVVVASTKRSRMTKRVLSQVDASHDQVVPQLGGARDISKKKKRR